MNKLDGKEVALFLKEKNTQLVKELKENNEEITLAIILPTNDPSSLSYLKGRMKMAENVGINIKTITFDNIPTQEDLLKEINQLNNDPNVTGIMVDRPFPKGIDEKVVNNSIDPKKDVDGVHTLNAGLLSQGVPCMIPPTAYACIKILKYYNIDLTGKNVVVVGRSASVGRPLVQLLINENATVTVCHSKTKELEKITSKADILCVAIGRKEMINENYLGNNQILVDVGIHYNELGKLCGDIKESCKENALFATPVPGGIGSITNYMLLENLLLANTMQKEK